MKTAKEVIEKWYIPLKQLGDIGTIQLEEAIKEYAAQFIDLAANEATIKNKKVLYTGVRAGNPDTAFYIEKIVDKNSILKIKELVK